MADSRKEKIDMIMALAAGRPYKIVPAHPELRFTLIDKHNKLFKQNETGEILSFRQIQEKYYNPNCILKKAWIMASVDGSEGDELYYTELTLWPITKDEIVFLDKPIEFEEDIIVKIPTDEQTRQNQFDF